MDDQDQDQAEIINGDEHEHERERDPLLLQPRTYDCIFCKRGFTTAQALGGHMNIHRKERAKAKPMNITSNSNSNNKNNINYSIFKQTESNLIISSSSSTSPPRPSLRYYKFMDSNSSNYKLPCTFHGNNTNQSCQHGFITPLAFHAALQMSFKSNFGQVHGKKKMDEEEEEGDDDQLDLELRLGYN